MTTTIKDAADDAGFIMALMALQGFNDKVYIKATPADEVYTKKAADTAFVKTLKLTDTLKTEVVKQPVVDAITAS
ncbi:MAG: collagen-like protein, partial [Wolbachia sp.]